MLRLNLMRLAASRRRGGRIARRSRRRAAGQQPGSLDTAALTGGEAQGATFNFRYFQNFEQEIAISSGFVPERLTVEVRSGKKGVSPVSQTFPWTVDAS